MITRLFGFVCLLTFTALMFGQTETATVSGLVMDATGGVVAKAEVTLISVERGTKTAAVSNEAGLYTFAVVQPGHYHISVKKDGFKQIDLTGVIVNVQDHIQQNFNMQLGSVSESVTVEGRPEQLNTTNAAVGTVVDRQFVDSLPLNGRSFQTLIQMSPGIVMVPVTTSGSDQGQFAVNGQRSNTNYFMVDGVSANSGIPVFQGLAQGTSGSLPATNIQGGFSNLVSVDALQEFKIETSSFAPENGRQPGGQISLVTRSGTNQYHGSVFEYFRNDKTDAKDFFDSRKPPLRFNDFGGTFGGPVIKDKTFFFFSYEGQRFLLPQPAVNTVVPSLSARSSAANSVAKMVLAGFPLPNGGPAGTDGTGSFFTATYSNPNRMDAYSIRVDHHFNGKFSVFGRYNRAPSHALSRSTSNFSQASNFIQNTDTLTVGTTMVFTNRLVNDLRVNGTRQQGQWLNIFDGLGGGVEPDGTQLLPGFDSCAACYYIINITNPNSPTGSLGGITDGTTAKNESRAVNVVDNLSYNIGKHQLKVGFDYRYFSAVQPGNPMILSYIFSNGLTGLNSGTVPTLAALRSPRTVIVTPNYSSYLQDTWRINQRLSLTYGFRWDINPPPHIAGSGKQIVTLTTTPDLSQLDQSGIQLAPLGTPVYETNYHEFAPRVGLAYTLNQTAGHETVLRAGGGMFYDFNSTPFAGGSWPYSVTQILQNVPFPNLTVTFPAPNFTPSPTNRASSVGVAAKDFTAPRTYQWNVTVEQALGESQTLSVAYVGALGRDLLRDYTLNFGTTPTAPVAGVYWSPNFSSITYVTNQSSSNYNALQMQFRRRLTKGLQVIGNYTWAHSLDDNSSTTSITAPGFIYAPSINYGNSDFDVRHSFSMALTYDLGKGRGKNAIVDAVIRNWSVNTILMARTGLPFDVKLNEVTPFGSSTSFRRANLTGASIWLSDPHVPGGQKLNPLAFTPAPGTTQGNMGRNSLTGPGAWQDDFSLHRNFRFSERINTELRLEAFNIFNHPNFTNPPSNLNYSTAGVLTVPVTFGVSQRSLARGFGGGSNTGGFNPLFQSGGPRSMQVGLRIRF